MLPLWAQWTIGASTVLIGLAAIALAFVAARLTAQSKAVTAQSKDIAEQSKSISEQSQAISEWQRHNQRLTNFKQQLELRVGHAHAFLEHDELGRVIRQLPRSPGEFPDEREARRQQVAPIGRAESEDFESLVFTEQTGGGWSLEVLWGLYASISHAYMHAAIQYQLPVTPPPEDTQALDLWSAGPTYVLVTRRTGAGAPI